MSGFQASFIHKNCCGQLLSAYSFFFSFLEILDLNLTFAVCRKRDCKFIGWRNKRDTQSVLEEVFLGTVRDVGKMSQAEQSSGLVCRHFLVNYQ